MTNELILVCMNRDKLFCIKEPRHNVYRVKSIIRDSLT